MCCIYFQKKGSEENIPSVIPDWTIVPGKNLQCVFHQKLVTKVKVGIMEWFVYSTFITLPTTQNLPLVDRTW